MITTATRYHDFSCGHRVAGHESKCAYLHGHNYRIHFTLAADKLDSVGRVLDFSVIKSKLCYWLEENWDHKFLAWREDGVISRLMCNNTLGLVDSAGTTAYSESLESIKMIDQSIVFVPFNPTAENMAEYLLNTIGPEQLTGTGVQLIKVIVEETRKCSATASLSLGNSDQD